MTTKKVFPQDHDPRLGWRSEHDSRSLNYPIRELLGRTVEERPKRWRAGTVLDQGREGACVGFAWVGELLSSPRPERVPAQVGNQYGLDVYRRAQQLDEWEGEDYSGTSVLAGAKVIQERNYMENYRWAFSIEDVRDAVISEGPVVIGIPWYESMYATRTSGLVDVGGSVVGGHAILLTGYHPNMRIWGSGKLRVFKWRNSWGNSYGRNGNGYIRYEDLRDLLAHWGEACVPVNRKQVRL